MIGAHAEARVIDGACLRRVVELKLVVSGDVACAPGRIGEDRVCECDDKTG